MGVNLIYTGMGWSIMMVLFGFCDSISLFQGYTIVNIVARNLKLSFNRFELVKFNCGSKKCQIFTDATPTEIFSS